MIKTLPITQARDDLPNLVNNARHKLDEYVITVNGVPTAVVMSIGEYEAWKETNEILTDRGLAKSIRQGEKDARAGRTEKWDKVAKELNISIKKNVSNKNNRPGQKRTQKH